MKFRVKEFINDKYAKAINILKENLKENYHVFYSLRLSELIFPASEYGSEEFFKDFELINSVSLPLVIYDTNVRKAVMIVSFDDLLDKSLLIETGIHFVIITDLSEMLTNSDFNQMYE